METVKKIVITGGGSGGHVFVASALITAIKEKYPDIYTNLLYIGGDLAMVGEQYGNSIEQRTFKNAQFKTRYIRAGKLQRKLSLSSIKLLFRTILGLIDSFKILNEEKPELIFSTGGFVSVPVCLVGRLKKIPVYLHEQTATVGLSNRIVGKFAKRVYIAFENSKKYFKEEKTVHVGNIVRNAVTQFNPQEVDPKIKHIVEKNRRYPLLYISGGSLGSHLINSKVLEEIENLLSEYRIILQTGSNENFKDYEKALRTKASLSKEKQKLFLPIKFIDDKSIGYVYDSMDLFIGRAGANTVYEIGVLAKPSIFIPIPWVRNNEQFENARTVRDLGLSEIIEEDNFKKADFKKRVNLAIRNLPKKHFNKEHLKKLFTTNAIEKVLNDLYT